MRYLSIDPGVHTAVADWQDADLVGVRTLHAMTPDATVTRWMETMSGWWPTVPCDRMLIEVVGAWTRGGKNMKAIQIEDRIAHLLIGLWRSHGVEVEAVPVDRWKGRTPKSDTRFYVEAEFPGRARNDHEADAIALGRWWWTQQTMRTKIDVRERSNS